MVHFTMKRFYWCRLFKNLGLKINKRDTTTVYDEKTKMDHKE